jgi:hypothetical protein
MANEEAPAVPSCQSREERTPRDHYLSQDKVKDFCGSVNATYMWHFKTQTQRMHLHCNNVWDILPSKRVTVFCKARSNYDQIIL